MKIRWPVACLVVFFLTLNLGFPQAAIARNDQQRNEAPGFEGNPTGGFYGVDGNGGGGSGEVSDLPDDQRLPEPRIRVIALATEIYLGSVGPAVWLPWIDVLRVGEYATFGARTTNSGTGR